MSYEEKEVRTTKVEITNPSPADELTSHDLAIGGIKSIMDILNDHRYIISIKMEIEHVAQPVEDYPKVFTAEIPDTPENSMEFRMQKSILHCSNDILKYPIHVDDRNKILDMVYARMHYVVDHRTYEHTDDYYNFRIDDIAASAVPFVENYSRGELSMHELEKVIRGL